MKKNIIILGLILWVISGCSLNTALSPEEASLFTGYNELTIKPVEPAYGAQIPERYLSQLREVVTADAVYQELFQRINTPTLSEEGESPDPEPAGTSENSQPPENRQGKVMILQMRVTNFKPVPSELEITRAVSLGAIGITCNFMDGDTGRLIDQTDFGDVSGRNRGNIVENTELLINNVGRDVVRYISQRKKPKPGKE